MMQPRLPPSALLSLSLLVVALVFFVLWRGAERRAQTGFNDGWIAYFLADLVAPQCHIGPPFFAAGADRLGPFVPVESER